MKKHFYKFLEKNPTVQQTLLGEGMSMLDIYRRYKTRVKKESKDDLFLSFMMGSCLGGLVGAGLVSVFTAFAVPSAVVLSGVGIGYLGAGVVSFKGFSKASRNRAERTMVLETDFMRQNRRYVLARNQLIN